MIGRFISGFINYNKQLSFDKQIAIQIIMILSFTSFLSGALNSFIGFTLWYQLLIYSIGLLGIMIVLISYVFRIESLPKTAFFPIIYALAIIAWPNNSGIDGSVPLFLLSIIVFCLAIYGNRYLFHYVFNLTCFTALVLISHWHPSWIQFSYENEEKRITDLILTYFLLGLAIIVTVRMMIKNYREARERAEQNEKKFSALFSLSPDPVFIVERKSGTIIDTNEKATTIYGYSRQELIGMPNTFVSAEPDKTKKATESPVQHIPLRYHRRKNGDVFPAEITSAIIIIDNVEMLVVNVRDISERKKYELALEQSETRLKLAVESAKAGIWELDYLSGKIDYNHFYYEMLGYDAADITNSLEDLLKYIHPDNVEQLRSEIGILASKPEQMFQLEIRCRTKEGKWKWLMTYGKVTVNENGSISKVTGINIDIDHLMKIQAELQKVNADKNLFMSILAHDLRGPFSSLLGFSDLLLRNYEKYDDRKILTQLSYINKISHNTHKLLEDLLLWSCSQAGSLKFEPLTLKLSEVFSGIVRSMEPSALNKRISLRFSVHDNDTVRADPEMLNTILRNLISNSVKFTSEGGEIIVSSDSSGENIIISIADNGIGITESDQQKLWNISRVFTSRGTNGETGTGLGLFLCKDFVEKHGGKIWVESTPGKGSRFSFTLSSGLLTN